MAERDYSQLRQLFLEQEVFPLEYLHKFVGKNTPQFAVAVEQWKARFQPNVCRSDRLSANQGHRSLTFVLKMASVEDLIAMLEATQELPDLVMVL